MSGVIDVTHRQHFLDNDMNRDARERTAEAIAKIPAWKVAAIIGGVVGGVLLLAVASVYAKGDKTIAAPRRAAY